VTDVRAFRKQTTEEIQSERKKTINDNAEMFDKIKLVCCQYFEKYD
jgi:hypothetical protein